MPHVHSGTPRDNVTIAGKIFSVPQPYFEGHTLKANEASALNQVFAENIRNNFAAKVKEADAAGTFDHSAHPAKLDEYASAYEFGVRTGGGGGRISDPVEVEALGIARDKVRKQIVKQGGKLSDYSAKAISAKAAEVLAKHPEWRETAKAIVAARTEAGEDVDIGGLESSPGPAPKAKKSARAKAAA